MIFRIAGSRARLSADRVTFAGLSALAASILFSSIVPSQAQEGTVLEPIIVTGEKLDRPYLDTFTSVGVATGEDIRNYNVDDLNDSFNQMANVRANSANRGNNGFAIRGVNADGVTQPANSA